MQTSLAEWARSSTIGQEADEILRRCVHCGFCTATCPTYQVLGDELDSPRGRIYLIKQILEGVEPTRATQLHLDRCLTCRNCETTCPSGVEYGKLIDIGRHLVEQKVARPAAEQMQRKALRTGLNSTLFAPAYRIGQTLRGWLPQSLQRKVVARRDPGPVPSTFNQPRQVLIMAGCVQPTMMPTIDAATIRVLNRIGIGTRVIQGATCCGALNFHLDDQEAALAQMRANIDAWLPWIESGKIEAIVMNASGCGATVVEYAHHLRNDPNYAAKARKVVDRVKDVAQIVAPHAHALRAQIDAARLPHRPAFHPPCSLQHWQRAWWASPLLRPIWAWRCNRSMNPTCAAVRLARTRFCNRKSPPRCAIASSAISSRRGRIWCCPPILGASGTCKAVPTRPCGTGSR